MRRLDLLFMSALFRLRLQNHFVTVTVSERTPPLPTPDPDRGHNMFVVNADALIRLTRAVLAGDRLYIRSGLPSRATRLALRGNSS